MDFMLGVIMAHGTMEGKTGRFTLHVSASENVAPVALRNNPEENTS